MKENVYCRGSLLDAVQMAKLFPDSKHFVDMSMRHDAETIMKSWEDLKEANSTGIPVDILRTFIFDNFDEPEGELVEENPLDWDPKVDSFQYILDESYRVFAYALHRKWPSLYRRISDKVRISPERYSIINVPNAFIVPGGRFREMYYWDSFFTIKGLLASNMFQTVKGMIENLQYLIDQFGFIPNGNRVYYLNRSQPPLLTWCVHAYFEATNDLDLVQSILPTLRKEIEFFQANRTIQLDDWIGPLFRYHLNVNHPRPESYREDVETAQDFDNFADKCRVWGEIAAAAESGRDFSSRWFDHTGVHALCMNTIRTSQVIPVDLNAIICGNASMLVDLHDAVGDIESSKYFAHLCDKLRRTIHQVFWNEEKGCWFDYDLATSSHMEIFSDCNLFPMAAKATHEGFDSTAVVNYLRKSGLFDFSGGIPCSLVASGQQWDFPNAWAPMMWMIVEGFRNNGEQNVALEIADKWIRKNYNMWKSSGGRMFEKYNVVSPCLQAAGGGGEYEVQEGFGWTNGVVLDFLKNFSDQLAYEQEISTN
ncbi:unnamed protein product [Auanema sp. JU1783]|nr:unnamed protein product [Auanema sp. JU1783]